MTLRLYRLVAVTVLLAALAGAAAADQPFASFDAASEPVFSNPHDLAIGPDGQLYVADVGNGRIALVDPATLEVTGELGSGQLAGPRDIDFDGDRLLVADTFNNRIAIFENGELTGALTEGLSRPEGVLVHPNGRVYVASAGTGAVIAFENGEAVEALGRLSVPHDIVADAEGSIWVADSGNDRLLKLSPDLEVLAVLDDPAYGWRGPRYFDIDPAGNLVVAAKYSHRVTRIAPDGTLVGTIGGEPGLGPGRFRTPEGVAVRDSTMWFSDSGNNRIVRYRVVTN